MFKEKKGGQCCSSKERGAKSEGRERAEKDRDECTETRSLKTREDLAFLLFLPVIISPLLIG